MGQLRQTDTGGTPDTRLTIHLNNASRHLSTEFISPKACGDKVLPCLLVSFPIVATTNPCKFTIIQVFGTEVKSLYGFLRNKITCEQVFGVPGGLDENLLCFPSSTGCPPSLAPGSWHLQTTDTVLLCLSPMEASDFTGPMQFIHDKQPVSNLVGYSV